MKPAVTYSRLAIHRLQSASTSILVSSQSIAEACDPYPEDSIGCLLVLQWHTYLHRLQRLMSYRIAGSSAALMSEVCNVGTVHRKGRARSVCKCVGSFRFLPN